MTTSMLTDRYELTMADTAIRAGLGEVPTVFQVFARRLPADRHYGVIAGIAPLVDAVREFRFGAAELEWLLESGIVSAATAERIADRPFSGTIHAMRDGEIWFPNQPLVRLSGPFAETVLFETVVISILNHACAVAAAASLMRRAAGERTLFEMGGRRVEPHAAVTGALAAYIGGFDLTSNLEAGRRWGVPTGGTAAHASVLLARSERDAFDAQIAALGAGTTLLVDTYDIADGIRTAVAASNNVGHSGPGAIRLDSGDPHVEVPRARALLDELGAHTTNIVVSGDLDEQSIAACADLPIATYGVGTSVATGSGHSTAELVYKLVAVDGRAVAKRSSGKSSRGGATTVYRLHDRTGRAVGDCVAPLGGPAPTARHRDLLVPIWRHGDAVTLPDAAAARAYHLSTLDECGDLLDPDAGMERKSA